MEAVEQAVVRRRRADAVQAGLILPLALARRPHRKDATMYRPQVVEADFIGMLEPVRVVQLRLRLAVELLHQLHQPEVVRLGITG